MAHSGWKVVDQLTDQIVNTPGNNTLTGVQVFYATGDGNEGSVFVPNQHYGEKTVRSLIEASADKLDTIGRMVGNSTRNE